MKKILNALKWVGIWIWCFPQQLVGLIVKLVTGAKKVGDHYEFNVRSGSVSLGTFVFLCPAHWKDTTVLKHEKGHMKQSFMLGWLYLLVIGLPSITWAWLFRKYRAENNISYYKFYTERWADKLGGVKR